MSLRRVLVSTMVGYALLAAAAWLFVCMPLRPSIGLATATEAIAAARARLGGDPAGPRLEDLGAGMDQRGLPVILSLYDRGAPVARGIGRGPSFGAALADAVEQLRRAGIDRSALEHGRLKLDRVRGRGFLSSQVVPLAALGVAPGLDGVGAVAGDRESYLTSDDLISGQLWNGYAIPAFELVLGLDVNKVLRTLGHGLGLAPNAWPRQLFRFRSEEYIESATRPGTALPVVAAHPPGPAVTRASLTDGARAGGAYLLAHLDERGRFDYEYYTVEDARVTAGYSVPRHAGAASFLAQLYALDHDPKVRAGAEAAIDELERMRPPGCAGERICVGEVGARVVDLGSTSLALVAAAEYQRTTGDARYAAFARGLAEFILAMQKPDGDFCHLYDMEQARRDEKTQLLYFSGEAAYGLAKLLAVSAQPDDLAARSTSALDRALEYLTGKAYASFSSQFYVGEDHWTCMAVDAGWDRLPAEHRLRYAAFCDAYADFLRRSQFRAGESIVEAQPHLEGAYGITSVVAPHTTPVGSRSETTISMWRIARHRGLPPDDPRVTRPREQVIDGMRFLLARQFTDDGAYLARDPVAARGGIPQSDTDRHVRIDFIQHSCSAMLRALELL